MSSPHNYRLYAFVANHYLSPLQCGLQTAHVVSELFAANMSRHQRNMLETWAALDKTIIICGAGNNRGVIDCHAEIVCTGVDTGFMPGAIFFEDEQSMNGMATACGVIVPQKYWDVVYEDGIQNGLGYERYVHAVKEIDGTVTQLVEYPLTHPEGMFIKHIKGYRLA